MHNIALIIETLQGGGAERCAADLSRIFSGRGFPVFIFTDLSAGIGYEYEGTLVDFRVAAGSVAAPGNPVWCKVNELGRLKERYRIDIAVSFMQQANYFNILSKKREKIILTTHGVNSIYAKTEKSIYWAEETFRELYQYADVVTFPSEFCRRDWLSHYGDKNNITRTVYNPVHRMQAEEKRHKENVVITVGRMHSDKRQWHLLRAFRRVKALCPDSKLIILGDGELRSGLEALVRQLGLEEDVEMPGTVKNVRDYLARAKVFAMTSRCEAMPCSVLEALSAGVPVVSCDCPGGIREALGIPYGEKNEAYPLTGKCGIITPYMEERDMEELSPEEEAFAVEIVRLLRDDKLRNRLAEAAETVLRRFQPEAAGAVWIDDIFAGEGREIDREAFERIQDKNINSSFRMYVLYYRLLEKWMTLHERGGSAGQYFEAHNITTVVLYGMGKMAKHLIEDVNRRGIRIVCAIDKMAADKRNDFPVITPDEAIPDADCIVVTPVHEFDSVRRKLESRTHIPVISLSEVIDGCLRE